MKKFSIIVIAVLCFIAAGFWLASHSAREPEADGRPLSEWLSFNAVNSGAVNEADVTNAVRKIGTNAIPILLAKLHTEHSRFKSCLQSSALREFLPVGWLYSDSRQRTEAFLGFAILGTQAVVAIPQLSNMLSNREHTVAAGFVLAYIEPISIPVLKAALTNEDRNVRIGAVYGLTSRTNLIQEALPELIALRHDRNSRLPVVTMILMSNRSDKDQLFSIAAEYLKDTRPDVLRWTVMALGRVQTNQTEAFGLATPFLSHTSISVRVETSNTLFALDPQAAQGYGISSKVPVP